MSPENPLISSPKNPDLFVSDIGEGGAGFIMTAHCIGTSTSYGLWKTKPDGENSRITKEDLRPGTPEWSIFRDLLAEAYISMPQNKAIERLLDQVNLEIDKT